MAYIFYFLAFYTIVGDIYINLIIKKRVDRH